MNCSAFVKVSSVENPVNVRITSSDKPDISDLTAKKWQDIIDLLSMTLNVPSALIMRIEEKHICVFLRSKQKSNPYTAGEKADLLTGLYCETVVGKKTCLLVSNAKSNPLWENNPDVKLNMISYLGFPLIWPDGEVFGTICVLDNKENQYNDQFIKFIELLRDSIEKDLQLLMEENQLKIELENRKKAEEKLRKNEAKYRELFNNMRSAVIIYNIKDDGNTAIIEDLNKAAEGIEKIRKSDIIGKDIKECFPEVIQSQLLKKFKDVWSTGVPQHLDPMFYEDHRIKGWRDNYYIFKLSNEQIVAVYDDISERMEKQEIINEKEQLICETLELDKLKTEFFANISHELKTPISVILGIIQLNSMMLQNSRKKLDTKKISENFNIEKQNCYRLIRLTNNLIDSTKLDSHNLELNMVNCDVIGLVKEITGSVEKYIVNNDLTLTFKSNVKEKVIACDLDKIERIMLNLLSNSLKFTEPGGSIFVNIFDGNDYLAIVVEDTGIGIPENKLNIVFDRFRQVDKSFTRKTEGSGIGLSIVKSLVELHGGTISVESRYGKGTKFTIKLPVKVLDNKAGEVKTKFLNNIINNRVERITVEFSDIYKLTS